jgi:hypothetical protein
MSRLRRGELRAALDPLRGDRQTERLRRAMLDAPQTDPRADEIVELLAEHPAGLSGSEIARRLRRSKAQTLTVVQLDPRLVQTGSGRGSRFRLDAAALRNPQGTGQEARSRVPPAHLGREAIPDGGLPGTAGADRHRADRAGRR